MGLLKTESCRDANFVISGGNAGCHKDNLWCHHLQQSWHHDNSQFTLSLQCYNSCFCLYFVDILCWERKVGEATALALQELLEGVIVLISKAFTDNNPDSKVHGVNIGPIWGQQDPGGPHVGPMNFAIWVGKFFRQTSCFSVCLEFLHIFLMMIYVVNQLTTGNPWICNKLYVSIVAADALVLRHISHFISIT